MDDPKLIDYSIDNHRINECSIDTLRLIEYRIDDLRLNDYNIHNPRLIEKQDRRNPYVQEFWKHQIYLYLKYYNYCLSLH